MLRALTTATAISLLVLVPCTAASASGPVHSSNGLLVSQNNPDVDEPALQDGNDDTGKYGLIGLSGMLGLFGYKKYRNGQSHRTTDGTPNVDGRT